MRSILLAFALASIVPACGGDDGGGGGGGQADAPSNVPAMITVTGTAKEVGLTGTTPLAGVTVAAYRNGNDTDAVAMATTDSSGNYTLTITTNGQALDGYVKATLAQYVDTYLYPPFALAENFDGASLNMVKPATFGVLANTACRANQDSGKGTIAVIVASAPDTSAAAVEGATVSSTPAATKYCYNGTSGAPDFMATATAADGIGYMFNVTGDVTVSAMKTGSTCNSHKVNARAGALTTTLIVP
ncbi:MAG: hypothetical protein HOV81_33605 [Kofleriaceae bacterium]|nr:hypothetical protein [Kofleriaceae bacterium]